MNALERGNLLITAGPTHEPIDAVRFIGNRSSGRLGQALATAAAGRGWQVTLLLGPTPHTPTDTCVRLVRFRTCADLQALLRIEAPKADVLVMAAAVADYRPKVDSGVLSSKLRRRAGGLTLDLEATPDLLAEVAASRRPGQVLIGFALEPRDEMIASARSKLERKGVDMIVANPLETMESETIDAALVTRTGETRPPGVMSKPAFAGWLLDAIERATGR